MEKDFQCDENIVNSNINLFLQRNKKIEMNRYSFIQFIEQNLSIE